MTPILRHCLLSLFLISVVACTSTGTSQFPTGDYTAKLEGHEITLRFESSGDFAIFRNGDEYAQGTYSVNGNRLTWLTHSACPSPESETATYYWTFEDQSLTFNLVDRDDCISRLYMIEKLPYELQG